MRRTFVGAALMAVVATAGAQTFVPRIGKISQSESGTWSRGTSDEMAESARKLAESKTFNLPNGALEPQPASGTVELDEAPANSSTLPLVPILGAVLGVGVVGVGVGTKSRWARSRA